MTGSRGGKRLFSLPSPEAGCHLVFYGGEKVSGDFIQKPPTILKNPHQPPGAVTIMSKVAEKFAGQVFPAAGISANELPVMVPVVRLPIPE